MPPWPHFDRFWGGLGIQKSGFPSVFRYYFPFDFHLGALDMLSCMFLNSKEVFALHRASRSLLGQVYVGLLGDPFGSTGVDWGALWLSKRL